MAPAGTSDITFDGNPHDIDRVLAAAQLEFIYNPTSFTTDAEKSAYLLQHFTGPALNWVRNRLASSPGLSTTTYDDLVNAVKAHFGYNPDQARAIAQVQLGSLKQTGSITNFLADFDDLCYRAEVTYDHAKIAMLLTKLNTRYLGIIQNSGTIPTRYETIRGALTNAGALIDHTAPPQIQKQAGGGKKKSRCNHCGKRGHKSSVCLTIKKEN